MRVREDDIEVNGCEEAAVISFLDDSWGIVLGDILRLDLVRNVNEKVRTVAFLVMCGDKVIEPDKPELQVFGFRVLQTGQDDLHDLNEILLQDGPVVH